MTLAVNIDNRQFGPRLLPQGIDWTIEEYTVEADGGPRDATVLAMGPEEAIWELLDMLRCPIEIKDTELDKLWWGMVAGVEIQTGAIQIGLELDTMSNCIEVIYVAPSLFGRSEQQSTGWDDDEESVAMFGVKELRVSGGNVTSAAALARRTRELAINGKPRPSIPSFGSDNGTTTATATIRCIGWRKTLEWLYYKQLRGIEAHAINGNTEIKLGQGFTETLGFSAEGSRIHDQSGQLRNYKAGDRIRISGSAGNDNRYTVKQVSNKDPVSYTASTLAFVIETKDSVLRDSAAGFAPPLGAETSTGWSLTISNSGAGNNVTKTVKGFTKEEIKVDGPLYAEGPGVMLTLARPTAPGFPDNTYTANTITIESGYIYKLTDSANGLSSYAAGDMVNITGAGGNSGWYRVVRAGGDGNWIELDRAVTAAAAGASITIARGSSLQLEEALTNAYPGPSITIQSEAEAVRQSIVPAIGEWTIGSIALRVRKVGSPTDNLTVSVWSNNAGLPAVQLDSASISGADLPESMTWIAFDLANVVTTQTGTTLHIVVQRSGALSSQNYYEVAVDEELGYAAGDLKLKIAGMWSTSNTPTPDADLCFRMVGEKETTAQIVDIVAECGQFFEGVEIKTPSGRWEPQWREGNLTAAAELQKLLELGTSDGKRLLARVTSERYLVIEAEAEPGAYLYAIDRTGRLRDPYGNLVPTLKPQTNIWANLDIGPAALWRGGLLNIGQQYIERATVRPERDTVMFDFQNQEDRFDLGGILDG